MSDAKTLLGALRLVPAIEKADAADTVQISTPHPHPVRPTPESGPVQRPEQPNASARRIAEAFTERYKPNGDVDLYTTDTTLVVRDQEREHTLTFAELEARLSRHFAYGTADDITATLLNWFHSRPVTDHEAASQGVAVLDWGTPHGTLTWRVGVIRPSGMVRTWIPYFRTGPKSQSSIIEGARRRAGELTYKQTIVDDVALWSYPFNAALSTSMLVNPEGVTTAHHDAALCAVIAPGHPIAVAPFDAIQRLADDTNEQHLIVPLTGLRDLAPRRRR